MQYIGREYGTIRVINKNDPLVEAHAIENQKPNAAILAPVQAQSGQRLSCIDPVQPLYELYLNSRRSESVLTKFSSANTNIIQRLNDFKNGPMGKFVKWVQSIVKESEVYLSGSAARYMGGKELLELLYFASAPQLNNQIKSEIFTLIDSYEFPYNDFDLHFILELSDDPIADLEGIKEKVLTHLPADVELVSKPSIKFNVDLAGKSSTFLKIELKSVKGRFDLIFEPPEQLPTLFSTDDLRVKIGDNDQIADFYSSDIYKYFEGQAFRKLHRTIPPDESIHRRLLLSLTRGFFASQELSTSCLKAAEEIDQERRSFLQEVTIKSHFSTPLGGWCYRLAHQMAWRNIPKERLPDGHVITETLNATLISPKIFPKAHALFHFIAFIALLEDHQGELSVTLQDNQLKLVFPGNYTLWLPCDPVPALNELSEISQQEWLVLKRILTCMPGWIPTGKVNRNYVQSVENAFPKIKFIKLLTLLQGKGCELLRLRLQAALFSYEASPVEVSQKFWSQAFATDDLETSKLEEMLKKKNKRFSDEEIDWMLNLTKENRQLCHEIALRLLQDRNGRAIDFLKVIELYPGINWKPVCKLIKEKADPEKVMRCLQLQRLITAGIQAVPQDLLPSLLKEIEENEVLSRLAHELIDQDSNELFRLGTQLVERLGIEEEYAKKIAIRPTDLDTPRLARYVLQKRIPLTEEIIDRLLNPVIDLKTQVAVMQRYSGPEPERRWKQVASRLIYAPGTWPATWPQIPALGSREQTLWTGVLELDDLKKMENAITTLLKNKIEPPGGRVAFLTWLHFIGNGSKLSSAFGLSCKIEDLFGADPAAVCATMMCCPGTIKLGNVKFACKVVEYQLNCNQDPWPLYDKLGRRRLTENLLIRWISQASPSRICQLLPPYSSKHPLLPHLKKGEVIKELSRNPSLHPWVFEILLEGTLVEWHLDVLVPVCNRLIEHEENPRRISLIAVYGERLPKYQQIWERVVFSDPEKSLSFTAIWLEQGIPEIDLMRLHMQTKKPHDSVADFLFNASTEDKIRSSWNAGKNFLIFGKKNISLWPKKSLNESRTGNSQNGC